MAGMIGCSDNIDSDVAKATSKLQEINMSTEVESFIESMGDSILPYFDFNDDGSRTEYLPNPSTLAKSSRKQTLVLNTLDEYYALENKYAERIDTDHEYSHSIARPLDYNCQTSLLAMNADYETIMLASGDTILSNKKLLESCDYVGYKCEKDPCDDSSEEDPYLKVSNILKKESKENTDFKSSVSVEIYPYRMNASSFVTNVKYLYSSAGSETYFKKRQRVWRGPFKGMVWRWASFDPDRNGVRTYCFNGCKEEFGTNGLINFECTDVNHDTDLDTCCDTEDITVRCNISLPFSGGVKVTTNFDENGTTSTGAKPNKGSIVKVKKYNGGVIGMHYVRHKDYYFKAKTSKNIPSDIINKIRSKYTLSYR
ncbi:MAG: hypothetical protein HUK20_06450 [Fibrobacter sp.]|nr:hypothetical protein [Fibrobacter sp.]